MVVNIPHLSVDVLMKGKTDWSVRLYSVVIIYKYQIIELKMAGK